MSLGLSSRTTERLWISQLIRQEWLLQFKMWEHRNKVLHIDNAGLHKDEAGAI